MNPPLISHLLCLVSVIGLDAFHSLEAPTAPTGLKGHYRSNINDLKPSLRKFMVMR